MRYEKRRIIVINDQAYSSLVKELQMRMTLDLEYNHYEHNAARIIIFEEINDKVERQKPFKSINRVKISIPQK